MKKITIVGSIVGLIVVAIAFTVMNRKADASTVVVYKSASCGCCGNWVEHMRKAGFKVEVRDVTNLQQIKAQHGVKPEFGSCHTAVVDGYVIEGHVPASQVVRLLAEKPAVLGLTVPGMPLGSPGMEVPNPADNQDYDVLTFDGTGETGVYQHVESGR